MYSVDRFNEILDEEFTGRLRLRESTTSEGVLFVEERIGRAAHDILLNMPFKSRAQRERRHDQFVRTAQGYALVLTLRVGDRFPCSGCRTTLRTPMMEAREVTCPTCARTSIEAFFPLNHSLIDHLRSIDPLRADARQRIREQDALQARSEQVRDKDFDAGLEDELFDVAISQIPKVGYTGKEKAWDR